MSQLINHDSIIAYFKELSIKLKGVDDFFRADLTELMNSFRSSATFPCLVIESHENDLSDSSELENVNDREFAFTIFTNPKNNDYNQQNEFLTLSEELGFKIISRLKHDSTIPDHLIYNAFKVKSVKSHKVGPISNEQLYGYRFTGTFVKSRSLKINPEDWNDSLDLCG